VRRLARVYFLFIATCLLVTGTSASHSQQLSTSNDEHTKWIDGVMRTIQTIKRGMTRSDLAKVFVEEGGLSIRTQRKYVFRDCPHIKVDVVFTPSEDDKWTEKPEDIVKTSITLSREVLAGIDRVAGSKYSRSAVIERAVRRYLEQLKHAHIHAHDLQILNEAADRLNAEAEDVLRYQDHDL